MKKASILQLVWVLTIFLFAGGCQNRDTQERVSVAVLDLLRGEITLCGTADFGEVEFDLPCQLDVRETFELAISLLHSFEYTEAEKAFVKVIDIDPDCAMAYWGVAMSNFHSLWLQSGTDYLEKGSKIMEAAKSIQMTERARDYIEAIASFYQDWETVSHQERVKRFERKMRLVYEKYKEDKEAAIFYALALTASADPADHSYKNQRESGKILESIFPNQPNHPGIAHYIIHNYDYPELAELALPTARRYAQIAPASAHAQHMPSHIFTRMGLWQESINSNLNSTAAALCYSQSIDTSAHWDEELHGMDYLVYAYLQIGENEKAMEQLNYLNSFKKVFPANFKVAYAAAAIPCRIALENRDWEGASRLELPEIGIDWTLFPWQKSIMHFSKALGAVRSGHIDLAESELNNLQQNFKLLEEAKDLYKARQVLIQISTIEAWLAWAHGHPDQAIALMSEAATMEANTSKHPVTPGEVLPAGELLGDLLMEVDKPREALEAYERDLKFHPNRLNGLYGAAMAARATGENEITRKYFSQLLQQT